MRRFVLPRVTEVKWKVMRVIPGLISLEKIAYRLCPGSYHREANEVKGQVIEVGGFTDAKKRPGTGHPFAHHRAFS